MEAKPLPEHATGGRLARILDLSRGEYLRRFDRVNLCTGLWRAQEARRRVEFVLMETARLQRPAIVLLGRRVVSAFGFGDAPFFNVAPAAWPLPRAFLLPHPSGLCREWNKPGAEARARELLAEFLRPKLP